MRVHKKCILLGIVIGFVFFWIGCDVIIPTHTYGSLAVRVDLVNGNPFEAEYVNVSLSTDGADDAFNRNFVLDYDTDSAYTLFGRITTGNWTMQLRLYTADNEELWYESYEITVNQDQTTVSCFDVSYVNGEFQVDADTGTGGEDQALISFDKLGGLNVFVREEGWDPTQYHQYLRIFGTGNFAAVGYGEILYADDSLTRFKVFARNFNYHTTVQLSSSEIWITRNMFCRDGITKVELYDVNDAMVGESFRMDLGISSSVDLIPAIDPVTPDPWSKSVDGNSLTVTFSLANPDPFQTYMVYVLQAASDTTGYEYRDVLNISQTQYGFDVSTFTDVSPDNQYVCIVMAFDKSIDDSTQFDTVNFSNGPIDTIIQEVDTDFDLLSYSYATFSIDP